MARTDQLDLRGEVCPLTFVRIKLWLEEAALGAQLDVLLDHEPATRQIPRSLKLFKQRLDDLVELEPGLWRLTLTKIVPDPTEGMAVARKP